MNSGKHIVLLTPGFPRDEEDSTCIPPLQYFARELQSAYPQARITVIPIQYPERSDPYNWHNLVVHPINGRNRRFPLRFFTWQKVIRIFKEIHAQHPVDLVHAFWLNEATVIGQRIKKQLNIPLIATIMGQDPLPENRYLGWIHPRDLTIVSISERAAAHLEKNTHRKVDQIIPWGLNVDTRQEVPSLAQRPIDILGVGSMVMVKRFEDFITAVHKIKDAKSDVRAVLIGAGMTANNLKEYTQGLELEENLELWGECTNAEVMEAMGQSRILLHPAIYEGQGYVFSEALAKGMSIVSRPVGAAKKSTRWRIAPTVPDMVESCLMFLQNTPPPTPVELFSMSDTVAAYAKLYGLETRTP